MGEPTIFAKRMKEAREKCNFKQNALALKVGITPQTISAYEKAETDGKGKNPTLENAVAIADELGVSLDWLCGRELSGGWAKPKRTLGDIARDLVFLEKSIANIYLGTSTLAGQRTTYDGNTGYPSPEDDEEQFPSIVFTNTKLCIFINDWKKIKNLYDNNIIDDELYNLWLDRHLSLLDNVPAPPKSIDFTEIDTEDDELPF